MAKLTKIAQNIFGSGAGTDQISKFGSLAAGSEVFTTDPAEAQSLSNWLTGWFAAVIGGNAPTIQDMNAFCFVATYQLGYLIQAGIAEWDTTTTYYIGSLVNVAGIIYVSRTDANAGNLVTDATNWKKVGGDIMTALGDTIYGGVNGAQTRLAGNTTTQKQFWTQTGTGTASAAPVLQDFKAPVLQKFTATGADTYTTPAGALYIRVRMVGAGGGGCGSGSGHGNGTTGGSTTFGAQLSASGGVGGSGSTAPAGGSTSLGSESGTKINGGFGGSGHQLDNTSGGGGGVSYFGGAGAGGVAGGGNGTAASTNSGSGGGGAAGNTGVPSVAGGAAGGYVEAILYPTAAQVYVTAVGAKGTGGAAGTSGGIGGDAGDGYIEVEAFFQ